jgi:hypothetical protein
MIADEPGICHAWRCPHCDTVQLWEIALQDKRRQWCALCPDCSEPVDLRYDRSTGAVIGLQP